jgi:hypothetical protein
MIPNGELEAVDLIAASDRALYKAKHTGRNRVQPALDLSATIGLHGPRSTSENCSSLSG